MALFNMFKTPAPQKFNYKPRTYNPQKEELLKRVKAAQNTGTDQDDVEQITQRIRGRMARPGAPIQNDKLISYRRKHKKISTFRILLIIFALCVLSYVILFQF